MVCIKTSATMFAVASYRDAFDWQHVPCVLPVAEVCAHAPVVAIYANIVGADGGERTLASVRRISGVPSRRGVLHVTEGSVKGWDRAWRETIV
jgi:hypothetical protein